MQLLPVCIKLSFSRDNRCTSLFVRAILIMMMNSKWSMTIGHQMNKLAKNDSALDIITIANLPICQLKYYIS